ncbi:hypothetical protein McanMca71_006175 [Microsporum canis]|uniref:Uncharacterized protein n=1 Tax=Arthroderma otae (strain ATCC MYA-4605 / CBS 113480) TaxID=554155 RepID=C5FPK1_ARTOC|nr:uncharacterized protein MCYG_04336 [Microsporum canis CBS 113480]EEQ31517.1 predicted protein [Microsporum canis CBS 113480]
MRRAFRSEAVGYRISSGWRIGPSLLENLRTSCAHDIPNIIQSQNRERYNIPIIRPGGHRHVHISKAAPAHLAITAAPVQTGVRPPPETAIPRQWEVEEEMESRLVSHLMLVHSLGPQGRERQRHRSRNPETDSDELDRSRRAFNNPTIPAYKLHHKIHAGKMKHGALSHYWTSHRHRELLLAKRTGQLPALPANHAPSGVTLRDPGQLGVKERANDTSRASAETRRAGISRSS